MATPTKTTTAKRTSKAPTGGTELNTGADENTETPEANSTPTRQPATQAFKIRGKELPKPPRGAGIGGSSAWPTLLKKVADEAEAGDWVEVKTFHNGTGATQSAKNLRKDIDSGKFPVPEGVKFNVDTVRYDVDEEGNEVAFGTPGAVRWSGVVVNWE